MPACNGHSPSSIHLYQREACAKSVQAKAIASKASICIQAKPFVRRKEKCSIMHSQVPCQCRQGCCGGRLAHAAVRQAPRAASRCHRMQSHHMLSHPSRHLMCHPCLGQGAWSWAS